MARNCNWLFIWLTVSSIILNAFGMLKANTMGAYRHAVYWLPPLAIGAAFLLVIRIFPPVILNRARAVNLLWWMAILLAAFFQIQFQHYYHLIFSGTLLSMAIVGQVAISTRLICLETGRNRNNPKYIRHLRISRLDLNWVLAAYAACLGFTGIIAMLLWVVPKESLDSLFYETPAFSFKQYRIYWTIELFAAFLLISAGYWKLIYKPVKEIRVV